MSLTDTESRVKNLDANQLRFLRLGAQGKSTEKIADILGISPDNATADLETIALLCGFSRHQFHYIKTPYELSVRSGIGWYKELVEKKPFEHMQRDLDNLSQRELQVLKLIACGLKNKEIASKIAQAEGQKISWHTVADHAKHLYEKLEIDNRCDATRIAIGAGVARIAHGEALRQLIVAYCSLSPAERKIFEETALGQKIDRKSETGSLLAEHRKNCYEKLGINNSVDATRMWVALRIEADRLQAEEREKIAPDGAEIIKQTTACVNEEIAPNNASGTELGRSITPEETESPTSTVSGATQIIDVRHRHDVLPESAAGNFTNRFANRHPSIDRHYR